MKQQAWCGVLSSSAAVVKQWVVDLGRRLHGGDAAAGGGPVVAPVVAAQEAALEDKVTSIVGESQEADEQADGPLEEAGTSPNCRGDCWQVWWVTFCMWLWLYRLHLRGCHTDR